MKTMEKKFYKTPVICLYGIQSGKILKSSVDIDDTETDNWGDSKGDSGDWEDDDDLDGGSAIW